MEKNKQCHNIKELLKLLENDELVKLAGTSTNQLVKPEVIRSREDAIDVILRHSHDISSILNRKCVRKEILFQYLHEKGISVPTPATKLSLINKIISLWTKTKQNHSSNKGQTGRNDTVAITTKEENSISSEDNVNLMATQFSEWFFKMLNENKYVSIDHFWQDCSISLDLISDTNHVSRSAVSDRNEVVKLLCDTKNEHGLFFNPNLTSDGVKGKMDPHGLVLIFVCGTLHTKETCVGVFEQMFALARDPFSENNWKIKNTKVNLKSKEIQGQPTLCDSNLHDALSVCK